MIGSENVIVRSLINHLGPWIGGSALLRETAATRMSQIAISYRDSPLSANHVHGAALHAGDRVPNLSVMHRRTGGDSREETVLFRVLDPSRFTLLVVHPAESSGPPADLFDTLRPWREYLTAVDLGPPQADAARASFQSVFGSSGSVYLIRPDGHIGFAGSQHAAARHLEAYCRQWLTTPA